MRLLDKLVYDNKIPKMPIREQESNKGTFGKVLNISGSKNYIGSAYLSTLGILKIGAGYTALCSTKDVIQAVSVLLPETVFLERKNLLSEIDKYNVILLGCGLGTQQNSINLFKQTVKQLCKTDKPLVLDADGLNILSKYNLKLPKNIIITPHPSEASRLLGISTQEILQDLEKSAKNLTAKYNCITVLKTHRTIVCDKNFNIYINNHGNSAIAKAGTGDVLAGIISGLVAQKMPLYEAAKLGVYLHSISGEIASKELTEYSVLASDITKYLPCAIKNI